MWCIRGWLGFIIFSLASLAALFVAAAVELAWPAYVPWFTHLLYALFWVAFLLPFLRESKLKIRFLLPAVFLGGLLFLYSSNDTRGAFLRHLHQVKPGMSVGQVEQIMKPYAGFTDPNSRLLASSQRELIEPNVAVYRWDDDPYGAFNADAGIITFKNNKVETVTFSPD